MRTSMWILCMLLVILNATLQFSHGIQTVSKTGPMLDSLDSHYVITTTITEVRQSNPSHDSELRYGRKLVAGSELKPNGSKMDSMNGTWRVTSKLTVTIKAQCFSQDTKLPMVNFLGGTAISHSFPLNYQDANIWHCHFYWKKSPTMSLEQTIIVWTSIPTERCMHCEWIVQQDGFYYMDYHTGQLSHEYDWNVGHLA